MIVLQLRCWCSDYRHWQTLTQIECIYLDIKKIDARIIPVVVDLWCGECVGWYATFWTMFFEIHKAGCYQGSNPCCECPLKESRRSAPATTTNTHGDQEISTTGGESPANWSPAVLVENTEMACKKGKGKGKRPKPMKWWGCYPRIKSVSLKAC